MRGGYVEENVKVGRELCISGWGEVWDIEILFKVPCPWGGNKWDNTGGNGPEKAQCHKAQKYSKNKENMCKGHRSELEVSSTSQTGNNLSIIITIDGN